MQYSLVTIIALAATGVYARAVPQPVAGLPTLPLGGLDITKVTNSLTASENKQNQNTEQGQKNAAGTDQAASQKAGASATGAEQTNKEQDNSCTAKDGTKGARFCCSPNGNTNTQTNNHATNTSDDDKTVTEVTTISQMQQEIETIFNTVITKISKGGMELPTSPVSRVTRRQASSGAGGDTNNQAGIQCDQSDSCSTEQKNFCFLNGNQFNLGPVGPLIFQEAPQDGSSSAGGQQDSTSNANAAPAEPAQVERS